MNEPTKLGSLQIALPTPANNNFLELCSFQNQDIVLMETGFIAGKSDSFSIRAPQDHSRNKAVEETIENTLPTCGLKGNYFPEENIGLLWRHLVTLRLRQGTQMHLCRQP